MLNWRFSYANPTCPRPTMYNFLLGIGFLSLMVLSFIFQSVLVGYAASQGQGQAGAVDPTFKSGSGFNGSVSSIAIQSDGKIVIGGYFTSLNGTLVNRITRLVKDGSLDTTFNSGGSGANNYVSIVVVQSDGKILVGGNFTSYNDTSRSYIVRLTGDGSLDTTFNPGGSGANKPISTIAVQNDGKILIGGKFTTYNGVSRTGIARLSSDGTLDTSFTVGAGTGTNNGGVGSLAIQSDGKIVIGGFFTSYNSITRNAIARLNSNGSLDSSFNSGADANSFVYSLAIQSDGKIVIGGFFTSYSGILRNYIARLNSDGSLDNSFNPGTGANVYVYAIAIQNDGKIVIGGQFTSYNQTSRNRIARLNSDGSLDNSFNSGTGFGDGGVSAILVQTDGKILIGGYFTSYNGSQRSRLIRLASDSTLDNSFNPGGDSGGAGYIVNSAVVQNDDKIVIGGAFTSYNGIARNHIARLNSDGTLDTSFNPGTGANDVVFSVALQTDGKILVGGFFTSYNGVGRNQIARLNSDGSLDNSFNPGTGVNNGVYSLAVQSDGKILIGGTFTSYNGVGRNRIVRLNGDGSLDNSFDVGGIGTDNRVTIIALQPDGKILLGGNFTNYSGVGRNRIARLASDGTLDSSFNPGTGADSGILSLALQPDGKILIGGIFTSYNGTSRKGVARLSGDGSLDNSFAVGGTGPDSGVTSVALQSDGKVIMGGAFTSYNGVGRNRIARLNSDGTLDSSFAVGLGANDTVNGVVIQRDGKILVFGFFTTVDTYTRDYIARLEGTSQLRPAITLVSSANTSELGQSVTFTASVLPVTFTGTLTFTFGTANSSVSVTAPLVNGVASYITNTLELGIHSVIATYSPPSVTSTSTSAEYFQAIIPPCSPQVVSSPIDDGQAATCGTLSYMLATTSSGTISFALISGNTITFTNSLPPTLTLAPGVVINGGANGIVLNGNGVAGDGLRLGGGNLLTNLTVRHFSERELVAVPGASPSQLYRVKVES